MQQKLLIRVDREIEFEVLIKSFLVQCQFKDDSTSVVETNEKHEFTCDLNDLNTYSENP
jgi:hypothetical protein